MYVTFEYEDGTKVSKEIDSGSTIAVDGVARNGSGELVTGASLYTGSCEGLTAVSITTGDESTQGQDSSAPATSDPDHVAVAAGLDVSIDKVASAETPEEHEAALADARADVDRAQAIWPRSADIAGKAQQLEEVAAAHAALNAGADASQGTQPVEHEPVQEPHVAGTEKSVETMREELTAAAESDDEKATLEAALNAGTDDEIRDLYAAFTAAAAQTPPQA